MLHLIKPAASRMATFALVSLLALGLLIGAIHLALPFADLFRSEVEEALEDALGVKVRVRRLGLDLVGLTPRLGLRDVQLLDPESGRPQLSLAQLRVALSPIASLGALTPKIESVTLVGARLMIKRLQDGSITVVGLQDFEGKDPAALTFFLGNGRFLLADSDLYWIDEMSKASPVHLSDVQMRFENKGAQHRIGVLARLSGHQETRLRLVGDMRGKPGQPSRWEGEIYLHWQGKDLGPLLGGRLPDGLRLGTSALELESWNHLQDGKLTESLDRIAASGLTLQSPSGGNSSTPMRIDKLGGLMRWRADDKGWGIEIKDLALTRSGAARPTADLSVRYRSAADGSWSVKGGAQRLNLADTSDLSTRLPYALPAALKVVDDMYPAGTLQNLRFRLEHQPQVPLRWAFSGSARDLSLDPHDRLPGVRGLGVDFAANEGEGSLDVAGGPLTLRLPRLLPDPIRLDEAGGRLYWHRGADGALQISSGEIVARNTDIATRSRFSVDVPANEGSPFLDLQGEFHNVQATAVRRYVPCRILKQKLASWLDQAFVAGRVPSGTLLFHGALAEFPFREQQGRFKVQFDVEHGVLDFHKDWPPLEDATARVRFENSEMEVSLSRGLFLGNRVSDASARIPNLKEADAVEVRGRVEGSFANALRVLDETPLSKRFGALARTLKAAGASRVDLDMAIPLRKKEHEVALRLAGELTWPGPASLAVTSQDIELSDLAGKLLFTDHGLGAESIDARLWDVPVQLRVKTLESDGGRRHATRIQADGLFPTSVLAGRFPSKSWNLLGGRTGLDLRLDIGSGDMGKSVPPIDFELTSRLSGLAVELPPPIGKSTGSTRPLRLGGRLVPERPLQIRGAYGDMGINLGLAREADGGLRLMRGTFNLGGGSTPLPKNRGLYVSGSVDELRLLDWVDWWEGRPSSASGNAGESPELRTIDLQVRRLLMPDAELHDLRLDMERRSNGWEARLASSELAGKITIPGRRRGEPILMQLQQLDLKGVLGIEGRRTGSGDQVAAKERHSDPRHAYALDLSIEQLMWGENPLGRVTLRSQASPDGLELTDLALDGPLMSILGKGSWRQTENGPRTKLSVTAKGSDLGEFLRSLEFKSLFHKAPADLDLELEWSGGPLQPSAADLKGRISIDVGAGSLLEVEPGVGRVLGILNLEALQRRLALDFSDLFGRGYAFEKISGRLVVGKGEAAIKELAIEGPSADVSIAGGANLVRKELNQVVTVTPRIGTGVAIASAVAGGPLVGAAVFLADKVTGGAVDKLGRYQYVVSGPWADPEISRGKLGAHRQPAAGQADSGEGTGDAKTPERKASQRGRSQSESEEKPKVEGSSSEPGFFKGEGAKNLFLQ